MARLLRRAPLVAAVALLLLACCAHARHLAQSPVGEVKTKRTEYNDPNGGVAPFNERLAAVALLRVPTQARLDAEAECRRNNDLECKKLKDLKAAQKAASDKKADDGGDDGGDDKEEGDKKEEKKEKKAPCRQSVFWSYFLGTTCLPTTSIDVKPEKKPEKKN